MRILTLLFLVFIVFSTNAQNLKSGAVLKPQQAIMDIRHYTIKPDEDPEQKKINGYTEITLNLLEPSNILRSNDYLYY